MQKYEYLDADDTIPDLSSTLVVVAPSKANVKVSNADPIYEMDVEVPESDHYMDHDLRRDVLIMAHEHQQHCSIEQTLLTVKQLVGSQR